MCYYTSLGNKRGKKAEKDEGICQRPHARRKKPWLSDSITLWQMLVNANGSYLNFL